RQREPCTAKVAKEEGGSHRRERRERREIPSPPEFETAGFRRLERFCNKERNRFYSRTCSALQLDASLPSRPSRKDDVQNVPSNAANTPFPVASRAMVPCAVNELTPPLTHAPMQPSAKPTSTRPCWSTVASMKSSRLRSLPQVVPARQMEPRCTGSLGVASTSVQVAPPSKVWAM